jgi:hypothetical protein
MWQPIDTAPFDFDLEIAVIDGDEIAVLAFPARRLDNGWVQADTLKPLVVRPTHWRAWAEQE